MISLFLGAGVDRLLGKGGQKRGFPAETACAKRPIPHRQLLISVCSVARDHSRKGLPGAVVAAENENKYRATAPQTAAVSSAGTSAATCPTAAGQITRFVVSRRSMCIVPRWRPLQCSLARALINCWGREARRGFPSRRGNGLCCKTACAKRPIPNRQFLISVGRKGAVGV